MQRLVTSHLRTFCHISGVSCEQMFFSQTCDFPSPELFTPFYLTVRTCAEELFERFVAPIDPRLTPRASSRDRRFWCFCIWMCEGFILSWSHTSNSLSQHLACTKVILTTSEQTSTASAHPVFLPFYPFNVKVGIVGIPACTCFLSYT